VNVFDFVEFGKVIEIWIDPHFSLVVVWMDPKIWAKSASWG
jgi:hypothetical protein